MAFKQNKDGTIEICCIEFLQFLMGGNAMLSGIMLKYPAVQMQDLQVINYCPYCGLALNPTKNDALFNSAP